MRKNRLLTIVMAALTLASFVFLGGSLLPESKPQAGSNGEMLALSAPDFLKASSANAQMDLAAKLDAEAGIAAYFKSSSPITIEAITGQFTVIETQTADYILGSVGVPGYNSHFDAHVYVHRDGWIMAYYLRSNPIAKIVDIRARTIANTTLRTVVANVASAAGAAFSDVSYYDFRYPNATHILMVAEDEANGYTFTINIPSTYGYYERGWSCSSTGSNIVTSSFYLDTVRLSNSPFWSGGNDGRYYRYGSISAGQLLPNTLHTIQTYDGYQAYAVLIIIYQVP